MKNITNIIIPARMESSRLPGKPLKKINGIPMIIHCAKNAVKTGLDVFVATDSKDIKNVCSEYNINSIMTPKCSTGTDRVAIASEKLEAEYVINLQGDEPLICSTSLNKLISYLPVLKENKNIILNAVSKIGIKKARDINNVKCSIIKSSKSIQYFSRMPLLNDVLSDGKELYYKQVGLYAMSRNNLKKFASMKQGHLEKAERVELLRWIENGQSITSCELDIDPISVDTYQDLIEVEKSLSSN